jgi:hypothetical protein
MLFLFVPMLLIANITFADEVINPFDYRNDPSCKGENRCVPQDNLEIKRVNTYRSTNVTFTLFNNYNFPREDKYAFKQVGDYLQAEYILVTERGQDGTKYKLINQLKERKLWFNYKIGELKYFDGTPPDTVAAVLQNKSPYADPKTKSLEYLFKQLKGIEYVPVKDREMEFSKFNLPYLSSSFIVSGENDIVGVLENGKQVHYFKMDSSNLVTVVKNYSDYNLSIENIDLGLRHYYEFGYLKESGTIDITTGDWWIYRKTTESDRKICFESISERDLFSNFPNKICNYMPGVTSVCKIDSNWRERETDCEKSSFPAHLELDGIRVNGVFNSSRKNIDLRDTPEYKQNIGPGSAYLNLLESKGLTMQDDKPAIFKCSDMIASEFERRFYGLILQPQECSLKFSEGEFLYRQKQ